MTLKSDTKTSIGPVMGYIGAGLAVLAAMGGGAYWIIGRAPAPGGQEQGVRVGGKRRTRKHHSRK